MRAQPLPNDLYDASLARILARGEEHRRTCPPNTFCDRCGRTRCGRCGRAIAVVDRYRELFEPLCGRCLLSVAVADVRIPAEYDLSLDRTAELSRRVMNAGAIAQACAALGSRPRVVLLAGGAGSGKSSIAGAAARSETAREMMSSQRRMPLWASAIDLGVAHATHPMGAGTAPLLARAIRARTLFLDDLGAELTSHSGVVARIIHARHDEQRTTWVSTGLSGEEIAARYSGGVERRLFENALLIRCDANP